MIKIIAAAAVMSLVVCSASGAGAAGGLSNPEASGIVQVKDGVGHARAAGRSRGHTANRGSRGFQRGRIARGGRGYSRGYYGSDYGYRGDDWGGSVCTWVGPFQICP